MKIEAPLIAKTKPQNFDSAPDNRKPWRPAGHLINGQKYYLASECEPFFRYVNKLRHEKNLLNRKNSEK